MAGKRYQIFFCHIDNVNDCGVADISADFVDEFCRDKIVTKMISYDEGNAPHQTHNVPKERDEDMDYDKSRHRAW